MDRGRSAHPAFPGPLISGAQKKWKTSGASREKVIPGCDANPE